MALNPGNEETLVDGKGVEFLGKDKLAGNLVVNDGAGKEERKQAFIKHLLYDTHFLCVIALNSHEHLRRLVHISSICTKGENAHR